MVEDDAIGDETTALIPYLLVTFALERPKLTYVC